jgi:hypothetical protein
LKEKTQELKPKEMEDSNMVMGRVTKIVITITLLTSSLPAWAQRGAGRNAQRGIGTGICRISLDTIPKAALDSTEAAELIYLYEEEKLARDVYRALYSKWSAAVFLNISRSEQRHSDAVALLMNRYGLSDTAANRAPGDFENQGLQTLYFDLITQGETSLSAALRVGATIEDLDFYNLERAMAATDNDDIKVVYQNLQDGTRNHIRTFIRQLEARGESYAAEYISAETLAELLSMSYDAGMGNGRKRNGPRGKAWGNGVCPWGWNSTAN